MAFRAVRSGHRNSILLYLCVLTTDNKADSQIREIIEPVNPVKGVSADISTIFFASAFRQHSNNFLHAIIFSAMPSMLASCEKASTDKPNALKEHYFGQFALI